MSKIALSIVAHADDTEFFAGGTVAKLVEEGFEVHEIITSDNGIGSFELDRETLVKHSADEAFASARILGKQPPILLGYRDAFLCEIPHTTLREMFMRDIRRIQPTVLLTFDPFAPFETHPDHRAVGMAATEAADFSHLPLFHPEHPDPPHVVPQKYFFAKHPVHANKIIELTEAQVVKKIDALCAHNSQMKLTIDEIVQSLKITGKHAEMLPMLDRDNYRPALEMMIKMWAQKTGRKAGYAYGEEFRYEVIGDLFEQGL